MSTKPIKKLYYSISEVAASTDLKPYVLRYWETEFVELRPQKNRAGNRIYRDKDIELLFKIKDLLYSKKYTIEGARNYLRAETGEAQETQKTESEKVDSTKLIENIQIELKNALEILDA